MQGEPVTNVTVEHSVFSTSISNIVRAACPEKNFQGGGFLMGDTDVLHMGLGGCGIPVALMELWTDPHGRGQTQDSQTAGEDNFRVLWQGPGFALRPLNPDLLSHTPQAAPGT